MPSKNSHRGDMTERLILIPLLLAERPHTAWHGIGTKNRTSVQPPLD
jgi:hypothetical protein